MISFKQAKKLIKKNIKKSIGTEFVKISDAYRRILAENIVSDFDFPNNNQSSMDGAVIHFKDKSKRKFKIVGESKAGEKQSKEFNLNQSKLIYTGAPIPGNLKKLVIPKENFLINKKDNSLTIKSLPKESFIREKGKDFKKNQVCLSKNQIINLRFLALAKSMKKKKLLVLKKPRVFLVLTGDELISRNNPKGIIESSNEILITRLLKIFGCNLLNVFTIKDDEDEFKSIFKSLNNYDFLITSGGISKGKYDIIKKSIIKLRFKILFDRIKVKPGKPSTFAIIKNNKYFLGLPGNPVSCFISTLFLFSEMINSFYGFELIKFETKTLISQSNYKRKNNLTNFLRIKTNNKFHNKFTIFNDQDSSLQKTLALSDGILVLDPSIKTVKKGQKHRVLIFKNLDLNLI